MGTNAHRLASVTVQYQSTQTLFTTPPLHTKTASSIEPRPAITFDLSARRNLYLTIYTDLLDAANNADMKKLEQQIAYFKQVLTSQIIEDFKTLMLVQRTDRLPTNEKTNFIQFQNNMAAISKKVLPLLNRYGQQKIDEASVVELLADLIDIGDALIAV